MGNMSYCRFQNTLKDFRACIEALEDGLDDLSPEEKLSAHKMLLECRRFEELYGKVEGVGPNSDSDKNMSEDVAEHAEAEVDRIRKALR